MQETLNQKAIKNRLKYLYGENQKITCFEGGLKTNVKSIDAVDMCELSELYETRTARNITAKRSGTGITIIIES